MSSENVEIARRGLIACFAQPPDLEIAMEIADPGIFFTSNWGAEESEFHGVDGIVEGIAEMAAAFDPWRQELEEIIDAGDGAVVAFMRLTARGRESGVPVEFPWALLITLSGGLITSARAFIDRDEALRAAGVGD